MIRKALGSDLNIARTLADDLNHQVNKGVDVSLEITSEKLTLNQVFNDYLELSSSIRESTRKRYGTVKDNFLFWCKQKYILKIIDITPSPIDLYLKDRAVKPIIPNDHEKRKGVRDINTNGGSKKH